MPYFTVDDLVKVALRKARKRFPPAPRVVGTPYRLGVDSTGHDAIWVWVVLDDATPKEQLRHASLEPIAEAVRAAIREPLRGVAPIQPELIPYVRFRLKSEQDEADREAGAS